MEIEVDAPFPWRAMLPCSDVRLARGLPARAHRFHALRTGLLTPCWQQAVATLT
ncbi:hypothetical protein [Burkholderia vietnamiensis]|uniref:hypothetical protein n=1 Tax=Burkholderia vietnamiensis TaxID=60552 RepID=UPI001C6128EB|nr:hypothetical protein [Burkholderia vietnamiensis]